MGLVQSKTGEAGNFDSTTLAFDSNIGSGRGLTFSGAFWNGTEVNALTLTDTRSTSWSTFVGAGSAGTPDAPALGYGASTSGGACTVTIDPNGGGRYGSFTIAEWDDLDSASLLDVDGGNTTGGAANAAADSLTTVAANTLVIGVVTHGAGAGTLTPNTGGGWTELGEIESGANAPSSSVYQYFTSAGSKTVDWSVNPPNWSVQTMSLKQAGAAPAAPSLFQVTSPMRWS